MEFQLKYIILRRHATKKREVSVFIKKPLSNAISYFKREGMGLAMYFFKSCAIFDIFIIKFSGISGCERVRLVVIHKVFEGQRKLAISLTDKMDMYIKCKRIASLYYTS